MKHFFIVFVLFFLVHTIKKKQFERKPGHHIPSNKTVILIFLQSRLHHKHTTVNFLVFQEPPEDEANIVEKILSARKATKPLKDEAALNAHTQDQVKTSKVDIKFELL